MKSLTKPRNNEIMRLHKTATMASIHTLDEMNTYRRGSHTKTRRALHIGLDLVTLRRLGRSLPYEVVGLIVDFTLVTSVFDLSDEDFAEERAILGEYATEKDVRMALRPSKILPCPLRRQQLGRITKDWQKEFDVEDAIYDDSLACTWAEIDFPVGWEGSGDFISLDIWLLEFLELGFSMAFIFRRGTAVLQLEHSLGMGHGYWKGTTLRGADITKVALQFNDIMVETFVWDHPNVTI
jgi:hypothetical protein